MEITLSSREELISFIKEYIKIFDLQIAIHELEFREDGTMLRIVANSANGGVHKLIEVPAQSLPTVYKEHTGTLNKGKVYFIPHEGIVSLIMWELIHRCAALHKKQEAPKDFWVQCGVCNGLIKNHVGSTPCCGSIAYVVNDEGITTKELKLFGSVLGGEMEVLTLNTDEHTISVSKTVDRGEFYTKLLAKLQKIETGELFLHDYIKEVKEKVNLYGNTGI